MFGSLRSRFVVSHVLPLLIVVPLMGMALIYALETRVLLTNLSNELRDQTALVVDLLQAHGDVWSDQVEAQAFVDQLDGQIAARIMLLDKEGHLLASSGSEDRQRIGQRLDLEGWSEVEAGQIEVRQMYSQRIGAEIVDALAPVLGPDQKILGVVRLSHQLTTVYERFLQVRYVVAVVLAVGLILGGAVGWLLALNLERPLQRVTSAVDQLTSGEPMPPLPERGPQEINHLLRSVNALVTRLEFLEQARRQFVANLVHELGRPLGALQPAIEALRGRAGRDEELRQELLSGMQNEIAQLRRLLDDVAGLHDEVLGTLELALQPTLLSEWLPHILSTWREAALAKGLEWQAEIPPELPEVKLDPERFSQAFGNLMSNAIKYTPAGGRVSVEAGTQEAKAWIQVSDTGTGIPEEDRERIFTPFYRSRPGRRFPQGMGLGLSIARNLIVGHRGWLQVESVLGEGSTFTIWLPLDPNEGKISPPPTV
ncbi:MAG: sensor histidine kinase [Anaerolineae bacterium]